MKDMYSRHYDESQHEDLPFQEVGDPKNILELNKSMNDKLYEFLSSSEFAFMIEDIDLEDTSSLGFRITTPDQKEKGKLETYMLKAESESPIHGLFKIAKILQKEKEGSGAKRLESTRKDVLMRVEKVKTKVIRKVGRLLANGEDWPITLVFALLYSDATSTRILQMLPSEVSNGYHRFSLLTSTEVNSILGVIQAFKENLVLPGISEDVFDSILALLFSSFTGGK